MQITPLILACIPLVRKRLHVSGSPAEVIQHLQVGGTFDRSLLNATRTAQWGEIAGRCRTSTFLLLRKHRYTNTHQPYALGKVIPTESGSSIEVLYFAPLSIFLVALLAIVAWATYPEKWAAFLTLWLPLAAVMHVIGLLLFHWERRKLERFIEANLHRASS